MERRTITGLEEVGETPKTVSAIRSGEYLLCIEGERSWTVPLPTAGAVVMGRGPDAGLVLSDALVSRAHAQILIGPDGLRLTDLGSRHGTLVNGERIDGARLLRWGDVIALGGTLLVVQRSLRAAGSRDVLDGSGFTRRLDEESERAVQYQRELTVVVLRASHALDRARASAVLAGRLRRMDAAALLDDHRVAIVLPELDADEAGPIAIDLAFLLKGAGDPLAIGIALSPTDGVDGDTLLASASAAADAAGPGATILARSAVQRLTAGPHEIIVADPGMVRLYELARRLARSDLPVLIQGETGVGKELAAAAIHAFSPRAAGPFVSVNCAAIPEALAESELFGHARGAFSGAMTAKPGQLEAASGGTLFLDEIGELALAVQAKLLRVLESGELTRVGEVKPSTTNIRLVAATNRNLEREVEAGRFRRDLFFRLAAAHLELPPLRDRPRDIAVLSGTLLERVCARLGREPLGLSVAAAQALFLHGWPGNVRELRNALDYAAAAAPDDAVEIETWHLPATVTAAGRSARAAAPELTEPAGPSPVAAGTPVDGAEAMSAGAAGDQAAGEPGDPFADRAFRPIADEVRELERARMIDALRATGGIQNRAAELIEMPLRTFATKLKRYRISPSDWT
ncbi:MAG TPA: sigma 54-interacting transcriptional regulator [Kofleriaceae bacterium]|nr:sigma 54-interacting transcriptional regulator [Kofleriaceae bacterium]